MRQLISLTIELNRPGNRAVFFNFAAKITDLGRILAIDYGTKRTGLAVTDPGQMIASPLETVLSHELMAYLEAYFAKEDVETLWWDIPQKWMVPIPNP